MIGVLKKAGEHTGSQHTSGCQIGRIEWAALSRAFGGLAA